MTRQEHIKWCKQRALEYLEPGQFYSVADAVASMGSDLRKHDEVGDMSALTMLGIMEIQNGEGAVRKWIEGFN